MSSLGRVSEVRACYPKLSDYSDQIPVRFFRWTPYFDHVIDNYKRKKNKTPADANRPSKNALYVHLSCMYTKKTFFINNLLMYTLSMNLSHKLKTYNKRGLFMYSLTMKISILNKNEELCMFSWNIYIPHTYKIILSQIFFSKQDFHDVNFFFIYDIIMIAIDKCCCYL